MKKIFLLSVLFIVFLSVSVIALETKYSSDVMTKSIFTALKVNDAEDGLAVISMNNAEKELPLDSFGIYFNEVCGHVKSYSFRIKSVCVDEVPVYEKVVDNKTERAIIGYDDVSYDCFKSTSVIPVGVNDYQIDADIERGLCADGFMGYRIDWQPALIKEDVAYLKDDWAWWNATGGSTYYDGLYTVHILDFPLSFLGQRDGEYLK